MSKPIDLSHTIYNGLETYRGLPATVICDFWTREESASKYENGETFQIAKIEMVSNTGTYIDFPFHRYAEGDDCAAVPIEKLTNIAGIKIILPYTQQRVIDATCFKGVNVQGKAVLLQTGWDKHWNTDAYHSGGPYLTPEAAEYLVSQKVKMVGIDAHNIDDVSKATRPVHSILLKENIYIIEHMTNMQALPQEGFLFHALPPKLKGVGSFPVRAYATLV